MRDAETELDEIEHQMKKWMSRSRATLAGITPDNYEQSLTELRTSPELEELLRLMATFPASISHHAETTRVRPILDQAASNWHGEQKLHVKRTQIVAGARVSTEWSTYNCILTDKALLLYSGSVTEKEPPTAQIELERYP